MSTVLDEFWSQYGTPVPMDDSLRSFAREAAEYAERHAPAGPGADQPDRRSGTYSSPGRGVSGESVN